MAREEPNRRLGTRLLALEPGRAMLLLAGAIALWWLLSPIFDRALVDLAGIVLRAIDTGEGTFLHDVGGGEWIAYSRRLSPLRTDFPTLPVREVHAPIVLVPVLIGWFPRRLGWSTPPRLRFVLPCAMLVTCQALALAAWAQQVVGTSYGVEGARLFSEVGRNGWAAATIVWRVGGRFVVIIVAWLWAYRAELIRPENSSPADRRGKLTLGRCQAE